MYIEQIEKLMERNLQACDDIAGYAAALTGTSIQWQAMNLGLWERVFGYRQDTWNSPITLPAWRG